MKTNVVKFDGTSILRDFEIFNKLKDQRQNLDDDVEIIKKFDIFSMMELNWDTEINCLFTNILRRPQQKPAMSIVALEHKNGAF